MMCVDDLVVLLLKVLLVWNLGLDFLCIDDVIFGCVNQVGEDNCNVVWMVLLLVGLLESVFGSIINCLCGFSFDVIGVVVWVIKSGEMQLMIVGGVESMFCVLFVMGKVESVFSCSMQMEDIIIGWCFINLQMKVLYGVYFMLEMVENVVDEFVIFCVDQDVFVLCSQLCIVVV